MASEVPAIVSLRNADGVSLATRCVTLVERDGVLTNPAGFDLETDAGWAGTVIDVLVVTPYGSHVIPLTD